MIKDGKEYSLIDLDNDPEWPCYCASPHCINELGYIGLEEMTPRDFPNMSMAERCSLSYAERQPTRKIYCEYCASRMLTEEEIKILKDEERERRKRNSKIGLARGRN